MGQDEAVSRYWEISEIHDRSPLKVASSISCCDWRERTQLGTHRAEHARECGPWQQCRPDTVCETRDMRGTIGSERLQTLSDNLLHRHQSHWPHQAVHSRCIDAIGAHHL